MPSIEDYEPLAPFTLDELVAAANSILRERPTLQIQGRTVRYYISTGLLSPPSGGPKFARYSAEHLRRIIAVRNWLDSGLTLEQAAERIKLGEHGGEPETVRRRQIPRAPLAVSEPRHQYSPALPGMGKTVRKLRLTQNSVLEIDSDRDLEEELNLVAEAIRQETWRAHNSL